MIEYKVTYKKVKHITLRIMPDGRLEITAPRRTSKAAIEDVITKKLEWIMAHQQKVDILKQEREEKELLNQYFNGGQVAYLGRMLALYVIPDGKRGWQWDGESLQLSGCSNEVHCRQMVEQFYRHQLIQVIIPALNQQVQQDLSVLQPPEPEFAVRKMRASWGLCYSQQKKIVLNLWLAMAPLDCIRQVLVHEYLHFYQNNHSEEFYRLLEQFEPQYRQLKHTLSVMVDLNRMKQ